MVNHLVRINATQSNNAEERELVENSQSFFDTDKALSEYFKIHVLNIPIQQMQKKGINLHARDDMVEWGNFLFVNPGFISFIEEILVENNYNKEIRQHEILSEGGLYVLGEKFVLIAYLFNLGTFIY